MLGNVAFSSGKYGFVFTLKSFAQKYSSQFKLKNDVFYNLLWGDFYFSRKSNKFQKASSKDAPYRTFVDFILEPLYKILSSVVSYDFDQLSPILAQMNIFLRREDYRLDSKQLLKIVAMEYFKGTNSLVDLMVEHFPNPSQANAQKLARNYSGKKVLFLRQDTEIFKTLQKCDPQGPLLINIVKLFNRENCNLFDAFGRVLSGTVHKNQTVKVLGENYTLQDEEDMAIKSVKGLFVLQGRYRVEVRF